MRDCLECQARCHGRRSRRMALRRVWRRYVARGQRSGARNRGHLHSQAQYDLTSPSTSNRPVPNIDQLTRSLRLKGRQRLARQKWNARKRKFLAWMLPRVAQVRYTLATSTKSYTDYANKFIATQIGVFGAVLFIIFVPQDFLSSGSLRSSEIHLAVAGVAGTALALLFSLAIIPAQRAVDAFSTAILRLYAQDKIMTIVFSLLSLIAIFSLILSAGWTLSVNPRYIFGIQIILFAIALDSVRNFYLRVLKLLDPAVALSLVRQECEHNIKKVHNNIERLVRFSKIIHGKKVDERVLRFWHHRGSNLQSWLKQWVEQLHEFAIKSIVRRDTLATNYVVRTLAVLAASYMEMRRSSVVILPDKDDFLFGSSDIDSYLSFVSENIKQICDHAAAHKNEYVVQQCLSSLAELTAHAMTITHSSEIVRAPLAFSPIFSMDLCAKVSIEAKMEDGILAAIRGTNLIISRIKSDVDTSSIDSKMIDMLFTIAVKSYQINSHVTCFEAVDMMLRACHHEIATRGFDRATSMTRAVLRHITELVPREISLDGSGKRYLQIFPPYAINCRVNLAALFAAIAERIESPPADRPLMSPFHEFEEASDEFRHHFREISKRCTFTGALLEKWIIESVFACIDVHIRVLKQPPENSEHHILNLEQHLAWFIHAPTFFFREGENYPFSHAEKTCARLSVFGMTLFELNRPELAGECAQAIQSIANTTAQAKSTSVRSSVREYVRCAINLELLARAADALGFSTQGSVFRSYLTLPEGASCDPDISFSRELDRMKQDIDRELQEQDWRRGLEPNPVGSLRRLLRNKGQEAN